MAWRLSVVISANVASGDGHSATEPALFYDGEVGCMG